MVTHRNGQQPEQAILAGGCFWCLEAVFQEVNGVESVESGYTGGTTANPSYEEVSAGITGHAEAVRITFDPERVPYVHLLAVFFSIHDPTTLNRQGEDVGEQYRSAIYCTTPQQRVIAEELIAHLTSEQAFPQPIVTQVEDAGPFYVAEPEHQNFYRRNPYAGYCQVIIAPKVALFRNLFGSLRRQSPAGSPPAARS